MKIAVLVTDMFFNFRHSEGQLPLEMLTSLMPTMMAPASGFSYQVEQDSQDDQPRPQELQPMPAPVPGMYYHLKEVWHKVKIKFSFNERVHKLIKYTDSCLNIHFCLFSNMNIVMLMLLEKKNCHFS